MTWEQDFELWCWEWLAATWEAAGRKWKAANAFNKGLALEREYLDIQPAPELLKLSGRLKKFRALLTLSQEGAAVLLDVPVGSLRDWEQARSAPSKLALSALYHRISSEQAKWAWRTHRRRGEEWQ